MASATTTRRRLRGSMSERLRTAREDAGLSRRALAETIGASERLINYYEDPDYHRGRKAVYVRAWADACGREFEEVWGKADQQPSLRFGWLSGTANRRVAA